ncbi:MAG: energy transducer TonB [Gemmatimonadaceae bacterium]
MIRLLESSHPGEVPFLTGAASLAAHFLLVALAVQLTRPGAVEEMRGWEAAEKVIYLIPQDRAISQRAQEAQLQWVPLGIETAFSGPFRDVPLGRSEQGRPGDAITGAIEGTADADAPALAAMSNGDTVMSVLEVDSAAVRYAWSSAPAYPGDMLEAHREGEVVARYVVDTLGFADTATFEVMSSTSRSFAAAVRAALPGMRFSPAQWNGQKVRQLVEQRFAFRITDDLLRLQAQRDSAERAKPKS